MAHIRQSRLDSGLGFQVKDLQMFEVVPSSPLNHFGVGTPPSAVERKWNIQDSHGHILALAFRQRFTLFPLGSDAGRALAGLFVSSLLLSSLELSDTTICEP